MTSFEKPYRVFSSGGGVQSVAVAVLQATGHIPAYDAHVFANVGERSENPATLAYVREHLAPYLEDHNITFVEVQRQDRKGQIIDLWDKVIDTSKKSVVIPAYLGQGGNTHRNCTTDWKIAQVDRFIKIIGADHAIVGLGISLDEFERAKSVDWHNDTVSKKGNRKPIGFWRKREYPLLDLRLSRTDCIRLITRAGLPVPPKSSCFFCPFKRKQEWVRMRAEQPALFQKAVELEKALNAKGLHKSGKHAGKQYFLSQFKKPLLDIPDQASMFIDDQNDCDGGYCHT